MSDRVVALRSGALGVIAYLGAGVGLRTDYDYYGRLAAAFLQGRWWLDEAPPWLNELVSCGDGRWCVAYPPMPAILAVPLVVVFPPALAQILVSRIAGGVSAGILYLGLRSLGAPKLVAIAGAALSTLGTTLFFSSVDGRAWYDAHAVAMPFLAGAFLFAARGERPWLVGALIGAATLARLPVAAATPALALLLARRGGGPYLRALGAVVLGGLPFALVYAGYNELRWGSLFDEGYGRLAAMEGEVFFTRGVFSLFYIPRHLFAIFLQPPDFREGTPWFLEANIRGMALFFTTPALIWLFAGLRHVRRDAALAATALAALLAFIPNLLHGTVGFAQFGYRFSIDAQPFLIALALAGDARDGAGWRRRPSWLFVSAIVLSILINVYFMVGITRFGYWE